MKRELEEVLVKKYPAILKDYRGDSRKTCLAFGLECGDGWYSLLDELMGFLQFQTDKNNAPQVVAEQIKEKFGGLRFYTNGDISDKQRGIILFAEYMSYSTCMNCGINQTVKRRGNSGWVHYYCDECEAKELSKTEEDFKRELRLRREENTGRA